MDATDNIVQLERVRCLECEAVYVKPSDGGTVSSNPGCPRCGYVGWILATIPASEAAPHHFDADRQPPRRARQR